MTEYTTLKRARCQCRGFVVVYFLDLFILSIPLCCFRFPFCFGFCVCLFFVPVVGRHCVTCSSHGPIAGVLSGRVVGQPGSAYLLFTVVV